MPRIRITSQIQEARDRHAEALERMEEADAHLQSIPEDAEPDTRTFHEGVFEKRKGEAARWQATVERLVAIEEARSAMHGGDEDEDDEGDDARAVAATAARIGRTSGGSPRVTIRDERANLTYRKGGEHSYYQDVYAVQILRDAGAQKRLERHALEMRVETRDITTGDPGAAGFIPPIYLADQWIEMPRPKRPFADALPKVPLSADGMRMDFPKVSSGSTAAAQDGENTGLSNTDPDTETYQVPVRTVGGYVDLSVQSFERSRPGFDEVVFRDLIRAYDGKLDTYLVAGTGNNGQHTGVRAVGSIQTVTQTGGDASDTIKKIYAAAAAVATAGFVEATHVVLHPRRAAAMAAFTGTEVPLLQQGQLVQAQGTQNMGFATTIAGLLPIKDANIGTTYGTGTNEDEIYVVALDELALAEGALRTDVFREPGSDTGTVRLVLRAYSAAPLGRVPGAICKISGTGLATPSFS